MASKRHLTDSASPFWRRWITLNILFALAVTILFVTYQFRTQTPSPTTSLLAASSPTTQLSASPASPSSPSSSPSPSLQHSPSTGLTFHSTPHTPTGIASLRWGIIFDAGSTGSRVHVYRFRVAGGEDEEKSTKAPVLEDEIFVEVKPGLSAYMQGGVGADVSTRDVGATRSSVGSGAKAAAESLRALLDLCVEQIPASAHANTPISLRATAGLRLLGSESSEAILDAIRTLFATYPFPFVPEKDVEVMSGSEEGVFAWITVNYLTGELGRDVSEEDGEGEEDGTDGSDTTSPSTSHPSTSAILDLGGASTQIVFEPSPSTLASLPSSHLRSLYTLPFGRRTYTLFETSYLGYGLMEARRRGKEAIGAHRAMAVVPPSESSVSEKDANLLYHPCLSDTYTTSLATTGEVLRGYAQGHASCAVLVRTLFPKHTTTTTTTTSATMKATTQQAECATPPYCSFSGYFALPIAQHAALQKMHRGVSEGEDGETTASEAEDDATTIDVVKQTLNAYTTAPEAPHHHGRIFAFSYFYDRTLDIFDLDEEEEASPPRTSASGDGTTILRVERIRQLADIVCSFSMTHSRLRTIEEIEDEKRRAREQRIVELGKRGCRRVKVWDAEKGVMVERDVETVGTAAQSTGSDALLAIDEGECMIEEKPDLTREHEKHHSAISSPLVALIQENPHLCFDLTYAHTLLHYGYELPESTELHITKKIQSIEVGWSLGAILGQLAKRGW